MRTTALVGLFALLVGSQNAFAWGDDGHKTIALIAQQCLSPSAKSKVGSVLAADSDNSLTAHDIANEATWADKYRDMDSRKLHYKSTQNWHFVDNGDQQAGPGCGMLWPQATAAEHSCVDRRDA